MGCPCPPDPVRRPAALGGRLPPSGPSLQVVAERQMLERFAPAYVVINRDEISETVPRRRGERDTERVGMLAVLGGASSLDSFARGHLVPVGNGLTIGRRPPTLRISTG